MSESILTWPRGILRPSRIMPNPVPFTRSGGRTLGGLSRNTRTDRGFWMIDYKGVALYDVDGRRTWNALRVGLGGMAGKIAIPIWSNDSSPWTPGTVDGDLLTSHDDGTSHSDTTLYAQTAPPFVQMATTAEIGDTTVTLRLVSGTDSLAGVRFSYAHALYETGPTTVPVDGDEWTVTIFPAIRAQILADEYLELALPTCLVHLASDREMDVSLSAGRFDLLDVSFVEAVDHWNDLALAPES